jgi:beta propeller repeat protein
VSGNVVIYADGRNGDADIRGYNVRRGEHFWVIRRAGSDQDRPAISGNLVVWQDNRDGKWSIRGLDLDRDEEFWVSRRDSNQTNPRVDGSVVVWEDDRDGCCDVYSRDLDSGDVTRVTDSNDAREPSVSGDWVVYRRERRSHDLIEAYNLATGERLQLNQNTTDRRGQPSVSDRIAVWSDRRNDEDFNVYGYDLEAGAEFPIARLDDNQQAPAVSGNRVVWTDDRGDRGTQIRGASLAIPGDEPEDDVEVAGEQVMPAPPLAGAVAAGECEFLLGFRMLRDKAPAAVGECLENEWHNAENGDGLQRTTKGLLVWRKADNWTAFTETSADSPGTRLIRASRVGTIFSRVARAARGCRPSRIRPARRRLHVSSLFLFLRRPR